MLRDPINMLVTRKCDIEPDTLRASRFRVSVATKTFFPPGVFVFGGFRGCRFSLLLHSVDFWPPMLHVQQSITIELDLSILATHEVNGERRMPDDSFEVVIRAVGNDCSSILCIARYCLVECKSTHYGPVLSSVITLLSCSTSVA